MIKDGHKINFAINRFLNDYRNTKHCTTGKTPAALMFNRNLRTCFDLLKPNVKDTVEKNQFYQQRFKSTKIHKFFENNIVYAKDYRKTYIVKLEDSSITKRHANLMIRVNEKPLTNKRGEESTNDKTMKCNNSDQNVNSKNCNKCNKPTFDAQSVSRRSGRIQLQHKRY